MPKSKPRISKTKSAPVPDGGRARSARKKRSPRRFAELTQTSGPPTSSQTVTQDNIQGPQAMETTPEVQTTSFAASQQTMLPPQSYVTSQASTANSHFRDQSAPQQVLPPGTHPVTPSTAEAELVGQASGNVLPSHASFLDPSPAEQIQVPVILNTTQFNLGYHVEQSVKDKIIKGEYINLANLLVRDPAKQNSSLLMLDSQGQIISKPKSPNKITSIERWSDAFLIFVSIFILAHPDKTLQLLKYMHDVRLGAEKSNGWVTYDEQFRLRMSINPSQNWGVVDSELWLLYMTPTLGKSSPVQHKCYEYNNKGNCNKIQCSYAHRCLKCNNLHPAIMCTATNNAYHEKNNTPGRQFQTSFNYPFRTWPNQGQQQSNTGHNASTTSTWQQYQRPMVRGKFPNNY